MRMFIGGGDFSIEPGRLLPRAPGVCEQNGADFEARSASEEIRRQAAPVYNGQAAFYLLCPV